VSEVGQEPPVTRAQLAGGGTAAAGAHAGGDRLHPLPVGRRVRRVGALVEHPDGLPALGQKVPLGAAGVGAHIVLLSGIAGLLAGALSMGAGEFVSVRSQREMLESTEPSGHGDARLPDLDIEANELALVYRARGIGEEEALERARRVIHDAQLGRLPVAATRHGDAHEVVGGAWRAALSSFLFFASGAVIPILPWLFGLNGMVAIVVAVVLVGAALMLTGATVGILSGASPWKRALRQLGIGIGAAAITYLLGLVFGVSAG